MDGAARPPAPEDPPGLQPERTSLAWQRTALAAAGVGVLCVLAWVRLDRAPLAAAAAVVAVVPLVVGMWRGRLGSGSGHWLPMIVIVCAAAGFALLGAAAAVVGGR